MCFVWFFRVIHSNQAKYLYFWLEAFQRICHWSLLRLLNTKIPLELCLISFEIQMFHWDEEVAWWHNVVSSGNWEMEKIHLCKIVLSVLLECHSHSLFICFLKHWSCSLTVAEGYTLNRCHLITALTHCHLYVLGSQTHLTCRPLVNGKKATKNVLNCA